MAATAFSLSVLEGHKLDTLDAPLFGGVMLRTDSHRRNVEGVKGNNDKGREVAPNDCTDYHHAQDRDHPDL